MKNIEIKHYTASRSRSQGREFYSIIFRHPVKKENSGRYGLRIRRGLGTNDAKEADNLVGQMNELLRENYLWTIDAKHIAEKLYDPIIVSAFYDALEITDNIPFIIAYEHGLGKGWDIIYAIDMKDALKQFIEKEPDIYKLCQSHYGTIHIAKEENLKNFKNENEKDKDNDINDMIILNKQEDAMATIEEILRMITSTDNHFEENMHEYICEKLDISDDRLDEILNIISSRKDEISM